MTTTRTRVAVLGLLAVLVLAALTIVLTSLGGDDSRAAAATTDRAFTAEMVPHHQSAVTMARTALDRTKRPEIRRLADGIIAAQDAEIGQMRAIDGRLSADGVGKGRLGGSHTMGMGDEASLKTATPFDRAFIDMMISHHQGAIAMARIELAKGRDAETRKLARGVIAAQTREIEQMNGYRQAWYGAPSPSGSAPTG